MSEIIHDQKLDPGTWLEQPGGRFFSSSEIFRMLLAALDLGWQVQEPVYLRPRWSEGGSWVFHFILQQKALPQPCLITAHWNPEIERFITQEGWQVDRFIERAPGAVGRKKPYFSERYRPTA